MFTIERHDSILGQWVLARWSPPPASTLSGVVDELWYFEGVLTHLRERHFPTGRAELIVHLGPRYRRVDADGSALETFSRACVAGVMLEPDVVEAPPGESAVLGMRLRPVGAWAVLGTAMEDVAGLTVDLEDIANGQARLLVDRCATAQTARERLHCAARWVEDRVRAGPDRDPAVDWMVQRIEDAAGSIPIGTLIERTGWSATRMAGAFRREVGVGPKDLARVVRLRRALQLLRRDGTQLARVALDAGYYDQSHFTNDFRALTGFAPAEYRESLRFPGSSSLAED